MELNDKVERIRARRTLMYQANSHQCICETLRMVYDDVHDLPNKEKVERMRENLVDAVLMAKKMAERLDYYYRTYADKTGNQGKKLVMLLDTNQKLKIRRARK
jgi:hypothetical protein